MRKKVYFLIFILSLIGLSFTFLSCAFASSGGGDSLTIPNPLSSPDIPSLINNIISFLFELSLILGPLFIVIGAVYIMTAAGNIERIQRGKTIILYTVIGMTIIILARVFIGLIKSIITG